MAFLSSGIYLQGTSAPLQTRTEPARLDECLPCADLAAYFCVGLVLIVRFFPYAHYLWESPKCRFPACARLGNEAA
jgi:hypothetical protein